MLAVANDDWMHGADPGEKKCGPDRQQNFLRGAENHQSDQGNFEAEKFEKRFPLQKFKHR